VHLRIAKAIRFKLTSEMTDSMNVVPNSVFLSAVQTFAGHGTQRLVQGLEQGRTDPRFTFGGPQHPSKVQSPSVSSWYAKAAPIEGCSVALFDSK
jgi:hypothetical protein